MNRSRKNSGFSSSPWAKFVPCMLALAGMLAGAGWSAPSATAAEASFHVVRTPSPNAAGNTLNAIGGTSPADMWTVGYQNSNNLNESLTLIEHFDGAAWRAVPSPNPGANGCRQSNFGNVLNGVTALSTQDAWAVGFTFTCRNPELQALILHWDGTSWKAVPSPKTLADGNAALNGITAIAPDNIYAAGYQPGPKGVVLPLVEHFDGTQWTIVQGLPTGSATGNVLSSITSTGPNDVWAIGDSVDEPTVSIQTMTLHFDGAQWSLVPSPNVLPKEFLNDNVLLAVSAVSSSDVTAVGAFGAPGFFSASTMVLHWDGSQWSIVDSPSPSGFTELFAVAALAPDNVYAAGFFADPQSGQNMAMLQHFDGSQWSVIPAPTKGAAQQLNGIFAFPGTHKLAAVGAFSTIGEDTEDGFLILPQTFLITSGNA